MRCVHPSEMQLRMTAQPETPGFCLGTSFSHSLIFFLFTYSDRHYIYWRRQEKRHPKTIKIGAPGWFLRLRIQFDSRFRLRTSSQGREMEPLVKVSTQRGVCLFLSVCSSPTQLSLFHTHKEIKSFRKKKDN